MSVVLPLNKEQKKKTIIEVLQCCIIHFVGKKYTNKILCLKLSYVVLGVIVLLYPWTLKISNN